MPTTLTTNADEESTYVITIAYTDEDGNAVTPDSVTWTLTDEYGNIINDLENVDIETPSISNDIVLSGDDLAIGTNGTIRKLLIKGVYDSDAGSNLPLNDECTFDINDFVGVT